MSPIQKLINQEKLSNILDIRKLKPTTSEEVDTILEELRNTPHFDTIIIYPPFKTFDHLLRNLPPSVISIGVRPNPEPEYAKVLVNDADLEELIEILPSTRIRDLRFDKDSFTEKALIQLAETLEETQVAELHIDSLLTLPAARAFLELARGKTTLTDFEYPGIKRPGMFEANYYSTQLGAVRASLEGVLEQNRTQVSRLYNRIFASHDVTLTFQLLMRGTSPLDLGARSKDSNQDSPSDFETLLHYGVKQDLLVWVHIALYAAYLYGYSSDLYFARNRAGKIAADYIGTSEKSEKIKVLLERAKNNEPIERPDRYNELGLILELAKDPYVEKIRNNSSETLVSLHGSGPNSLSTPNIKEICDLLVTRQIISLNILNRFHQGEHFRMLCHAILKSELTTLELLGTAFYPYYLRKLSTLLPKTSITLLYLAHFKKNNTLAESLAALNLLLGKNPKISHIVLTSDSSTDEDLLKFLEEMPDSAKLQKLELHGPAEFISIKVIRALTRLAKRMISLTEIEIPSSNPSDVASLFGTSQSAYDKALLQLKKALSHSTGLQSPTPSVTPVKAAAPTPEPVNDEDVLLNTSSIADKFMRKVFRMAPVIALEEVATFKPE